MRTSGKFGYVVALIALLSTLFSSYALASYSCPGLNQNIGSTSEHGMPGCKNMDQKQPGLCHAHAQVGDQSLDKPQLPTFGPFIVATVLFAFRPENKELFSDLPSSLPLTRATAPSASIQYCCLRT